MRWLARLWKKKLEPSWEFETGGVVWKILPAGRSHFVGEDRDVAKKSVEFFCLDRGTGRELWKKNPLGERWWAGIEGSLDDVVFVHEYATPDMPDHKKVLAMHLLSGEILWSNDDVTFGFASADSVYAVSERFERRVWFELDLRTGTSRGEVDPEEIRRRREAVVSSAAEDPKFPTPVDIEQFDKSLPEYVRRELQRAANPVAAEYIEGAAEFILAYHDKAGIEPGALDIREELIVIAKPDGRVLFRDTLAETAAAALRDTFFVMDRTLYYVRGNKTLVALNLPA